MLPKDWLEYVASLERKAGQRPANAPRKPQGVGVGKGGARFQRPEQRRATRQSGNTVRAMYQEVTPQNHAVTRKDSEGLTTNIGGNCESPQYFSGKSTGEVRAPKWEKKPKRYS
jgi:hypothetical protein